MSKTRWKGTHVHPQAHPIYQSFAIPILEPQSVTQFEGLIGGLRNGNFWNGDFPEQPELPP